MTVENRVGELQYISEMQFGSAPIIRYNLPAGKVGSPCASYASISPVISVAVIHGAVLLRSKLYRPRRPRKIS